MRDVKPVFAWARAHGDSKIVDRVIIRLLPQLQAHGLYLSEAQVEADDQTMVPDPVYDLVKETAEALIASDTVGGERRVRHQ